MNSKLLITLFLGVIHSAVVRADLTDSIDSEGTSSTGSRNNTKEREKESPLPEKVEDASKKSPGFGPKPSRKKESGSTHGAKQNSTDAKISDQLPVLFEGEGLKGLKEEGMVELIKNVVVTQGDFNLKSEKANVLFDAANNEVKRVTATGTVMIEKLDIVSGKKVKARGDSAEFDAIKQIVTLKGNAELFKGDDVIRGQVIDYDMKTGWVSARKVKGVVNP